MSDKRIEDYALIGDGETAALVHRSGAIEWVCLPRFDSEACFAALLGDEENGCWKMAPRGDVRESSRRYRGDTLILETEFATDQGRVRVTDFMPTIRAEAPDIVRIVECIEGDVDMVSELILRFDYGRIHPLVRSDGGSPSIAMSGPDGVKLDFDVPIEFADRRFTSRFSLRHGERAHFVLTWFRSFEDVPRKVDPARALAETERYWREWTGHVGYDGPWRDSVIRSLITLKALIHRRTGGIIAAPTSSLPENPGGTRNWDYRYCWLRDATFTLMAMGRFGLHQEARDWVGWLCRAVGGDPIEVQPFYSVVGQRRSIEWQAGWLKGFNGARPVRFGNGAEGQLQLDIYGEVIDAIYQAASEGMADSDSTDRLMRMLVGKLEAVWQQPDAGIWEFRSQPSQHVYSKVMCWVAFDRASGWFSDSDPKLAARYRQLAAKVHAEVLDKGFDRERNTFTRGYDDRELDAANLRIPLVGFMPADDPRMCGTVEAIEQGLCRSDGLLMRYRPAVTEDGLAQQEEGALVAANFWLVDVYHLQGREDDARALFERLVSRANDLGLLAEELAEGEGQLGNFPQGLSHLSLVAAAHRLAGGKATDRQAVEQPTTSAAVA
jgi:GH15 family glucan-1,4-alpha-glucosidase